MKAAPKLNRHHIKKDNNMARPIITGKLMLIEL